MRRTSLFDDRMAIFLAAVCSQTYEQYNDPAGSFVVPQLYEVVSTFHAKSITGQSERFGFIIQSEDRIIIAFRGTSSATDWISDAIARQAKYKCVPDSGLTHVGISAIYYSAREQILNVLDRLSVSKALLITGHSLGGALATLCALDVAVNSKFDHPIIYTYASPRVGDPAFARNFAVRIDQSYRVYNPIDIVPRLPPHIYKLPKSKKTYHYMHIHNPIPLQFHNGSVSANHVISSYFAELAKRNPQFTQVLNQRNPDLCPRLEGSN
jgi:triacylglycerol lipase